MMIHCKFQPERACECGHSCVIVQYSVDEVEAMFADFFQSAEWKDYSIKTYVWNESTIKTHAIVRHMPSGEISEWAMDVVTRVPYLIAKFPTTSVRSKKHRPRKPGSAIWRATQAWQNR